MTPEATLWAETQQAPLVACPHREMREDSGLNAGGHDPACTCGGTGEVRSDVYRAIERAITVPCDNCLRWKYTDGCELCFDRTGRVLRPQPGVMACKCSCHSRHRWNGKHLEMCQPYAHYGNDVDITVPDPSEAGVVARAEERGRLGLVVSALWGYQPMTPALFEAREDLRECLADGDNDGALAATLAAVRALAA